MNAADKYAFMFKFFFGELLLFFVFRYFLLIFCSSVQDTSLHDAAHYGHTAVCELLIAGKADVNAKAHGRTPLNLAIFENKPDVVALLRSVGASQ